jgi:NAD(P)H-hydrate repair Nnr-like enzyme with NAD(P)H-hydrate epimerase domain
MFRVIANKKKSDYEYSLISPTGEELNGGDGLHNQTALQLQADMLNQQTAALQSRLKELEEANINLWQLLEAAQQMAQNYRDDFKTIIDNAHHWTVDRIRRYCVGVLQGITKQEGE